MRKVFIEAGEVHQGDTLVLDPVHGLFFVERVSQRDDGKVGLHALNDTHKFFFQPRDLVRVLLGDDRAVAGDATATIEADLAITRMKQSGQWDDIRFADSRRAEFQELAWYHHRGVR